MNVFLVTPTGEQGPLTAAQINRLHAQGKLDLEGKCRIEGTEEHKPIKEVFRHLAPNTAVVSTARKQVATYNRNAGDAGVTTGGIMMVIGFFCVFFFNPLNLGFGLIIVGAGLLANGKAHLRRARQAAIGGGSDGVSGHAQPVGSPAQATAAGPQHKETQEVQNKPAGANEETYNY